MDLCKYCKEKNFTKEEYISFKNNIKATANDIRSNLKYRGGMYYNTSNLLKNTYNDDIKHFVIQELKTLGIEFIDNDNLYRVTD
ncbi:hypothetical protein QB607_003215 [Clostridium botulinum]|nr:hypothetical protein [Clostridium botulinum]EKS4395888.1 hypothetical protein [Clostridium botulinum]